MNISREILSFFKLIIFSKLSSLIFEGAYVENDICKCDENSIRMQFVDIYHSTSGIECMKCAEIELINSNQTECILCSGTGAYLSSKNKCKCRHSSKLIDNVCVCRDKFLLSSSGKCLRCKNGYLNEDEKCTCHNDYILGLDNECQYCKDGFLDQDNHCACNESFMISENNECIQPG